MIIDLEKYSLDGKFYDYEEGEQKAQLQIRPFPRSLEKLTINKDGSYTQTGLENYEVFNYCLMAWKNVVNKDKEEIKLTPEIKKRLFDRGHKIVAFVFRKNVEIQAEVDEQIKN